MAKPNRPHVSFTPRMNSCPADILPKKATSRDDLESHNDGDEQMQETLEVLRRELEMLQGKKSRGSRVTETC